MSLKSQAIQDANKWFKSDKTYHAVRQQHRNLFELINTKMESPKYSEAFQLQLEKLANQATDVNKSGGINKKAVVLVVAVGVGVYIYKTNKAKQNTDEK